MAEEETMPNIDWGRAAESGTATHFDFVPIPGHRFVRMTVTTSDGARIEVAVEHDMVVRLLKALDAVRQRLGLPSPLDAATKHISLGAVSKRESSAST